MTQSPQSPELSIETDVASVATWHANDDDLLLLDVREPSEYETARIAGSVLIPMSELGDRWWMRKRN